MLDIVHCLRYNLYTRHFVSWFYSRLQVIGCHYTDTFSCIVSDNGRDRTQILSYTRLISTRPPGEYSQLPKRRVYQTYLRKHSVSIMNQPLSQNFRE
jgi:hypothetical protein